MPLPSGAAPAAARAGGTALDALRDGVRTALAQPPCLVSFSGGIDSSVVLAVAVDVARREGLQPPVPITYRFTGAPAADEAEWQERVIASLEVGDWLRLEGGDELDLVGPVARAAVREHGLLWPANTYLHAPLLARAAGGTLLTGIGGDQLEALWHPRMRALADARARRRTAAPRDAARWLSAFRPPKLTVPAPSWLTPSAARAFGRAWAEGEPRSPARYDTYLRGLAARRTESVAREGLKRLGAVVSPLLDPGFLAALAAAGGRDGFGGRTAALRHVLGPLWPRTLDERRTKATFDEVFWRSPSRDFARSWDGEGVDRELVDPEALRAAWLASPHDLRCALLLQQLACAD